MTQNEDKAALITGGAKRIGRALALALAGQGYHVALHYGTSADMARQTAEEVRARGVCCELFRCDLTQSRQIERFVPAVVKKFPGLRVLINNASLYQPSRLRDPDMGGLDRMLAIHLKAPCLLSSLFARLVSRGQIINLLDANIVRDRSGYFYYLLSKKALAEFTKMAALELAPEIRVNAVAPGAVLPPEGQGEAYLKKIARAMPLRRGSSLESVAAAVTFLLDNDAYTGQILFPDGGLNLI